LSKSLAWWGICTGNHQRSQFFLAVQPFVDKNVGDFVFLENLSHKYLSSAKMRIPYTKCSVRGSEWLALVFRWPAQKSYCERRLLGDKFVVIVPKKEMANDTV
jgi:hypothetical protein